MNSGETWREPIEASLWKLSDPTDAPSPTRLHLRSPLSKGRLMACWAQTASSLQSLGFPRIPYIYICRAWWEDRGYLLLLCTFLHYFSNKNYSWQKLRGRLWVVWILVCEITYGKKRNHKKLKLCLVGLKLNLLAVRVNPTKTNGKTDNFGVWIKNNNEKTQVKQPQILVYVHLCEIWVSHSQISALPLRSMFVTAFSPTVFISLCCCT